MAMKYWSDLTKKVYDTPAELNRAEKAYKEAEEAERRAAEEAKRKEEELKATRATRAKEIEDAYAEATKALAKYSELKNKFIKDFGSYHMTFTSKNSTPVHLTEGVSSLLRSLFF